jgi:hypothetical protein
MRALCGAIITAGAMIGLGLTALGIGTRYQNQQTTSGQAPPVMHVFTDPQIDHPLAFALSFLTIMALIGLAIAFVGLAYHHHRRHHEHLWELERRGGAHAPREPAMSPAPPPGTP